MKNKITVTIGIPAYNEEKSIKQVLLSLLSQETQQCTIEKIIVISDGSTDKTDTIVESLSDKKTIVINDGERKGQPARIAELLSGFTTDVFVLLDADLVIKDFTFIEKLVSNFSKENNVGLVASHPLPLPAKTFLGSAINNYRYAKDYVKSDFDFGNTAYGAHACLAYAKDFAKKLRIPQDILSVDSFSYFSCITKGFTFIHARNAIIYFHSPQTLQDQINQAKRHFAGRPQLYKYFDTTVIDKGFYVPFNVEIKIMLYQLIKNPIGYIFLKLINTYCVKKIKFEKNATNNKWVMIHSTKN